MPANEVKIVFTADDSGLAGAVNRVNKELDELSKDGHGAKVGEAFEKNAEGVKKLGRELQDSGEQHKKHAEAVKKSREETELFGKTGEKVKEQVVDFRRELVGFGAGFLGISAAFEMVKKVFEEGQAFSAARGRFLNLIGDSEQTREEFEQLEKVADQTGLHIGDIAKGAEELYAAGEGVGTLADQMENLAKVSVITGTDIDTLTELISRLKTHGDVSFREIFRLTQATGGATRELAMQYRDLPKILDAVSSGFETMAKMEDVAHQAAEKHISAMEEVAKKGGLAEAVFADYAKALGRLGQVAPGQLPVFDFSAMFDTRRFGAAGQKMARELWGSISAGIQQISHESGISIGSVEQMIRQGLYSMDELLGKARERRDAMAQMAKDQMAAAKAQTEALIQGEQIQILDKIVAKLQDGNAIQQQFTRSIQGWGSEVRLMSHQVEKAFEGIGLSWKDALKPALDALSHGDWGGAFRALPGWIQAVTIAWGAFESAVITTKVIQTIADISRGITALIASVEALTVAEEAEEAIAAKRAATGGAAGQFIKGFVGAELAGGLSTAIRGIPWAELGSAAAAVFWPAFIALGAAKLGEMMPKQPQDVGIKPEDIEDGKQRPGSTWDVMERARRLKAMGVERPMEQAQREAREAAEKAGTPHAPAPLPEAGPMGGMGTPSYGAPAAPAAGTEEAPVGAYAPPPGYGAPAQPVILPPGTPSQEERVGAERARMPQFDTKAAQLFVDKFAEDIVKFQDAFEKAKQGDVTGLAPAKAELDRLMGLISAVKDVLNPEEAEKFESAMKQGAADWSSAAMAAGESGDKAKQGGDAILSAAGVIKDSGENFQQSLKDGTDQFRAGAEAIKSSLENAVASAQRGVQAAQVSLAQAHVKGQADIASASTEGQSGVEQAYTAWFFARGPEAKQAEVGVRQAEIRKQAMVEEAQIRAAEAVQERKLELQQKEKELDEEEKMLKRALSPVTSSLGFNSSATDKNTASLDSNTAALNARAGGGGAGTGPGTGGGAAAGPGAGGRLPGGGYPSGVTPPGLSPEDWAKQPGAQSLGDVSPMMTIDPRTGQMVPQPGSRMLGPVVDVGAGLAPLPDTAAERQKARDFFPFGTPLETGPGGYGGSFPGVPGVPVRTRDLLGAPAGAGASAAGGLEKISEIGPKIDTSNEHLSTIASAITKVLSASGAT